MNIQIACENMIKQQLRTGNVQNESILTLYKEINREDFVPKKYSQFAYSDIQIELPHNQRMMTPLEEALILQALDLNGSEVVLEVGTGTGFLTALLSRLCKRLVSIDYYEDFTKNAHKVLTQYQCNNVELITGDAFKGWVDKAPYDRIIFSGAQKKLTETQQLQLVPGGTLIAIIGDEPIMKTEVHTLNHNGIWTKRLLLETNLPPLINKIHQSQFVF